MRSDLK